MRCAVGALLRPPRKHTKSPPSGDPLRRSTLVGTEVPIPGGEQQESEDLVGDAHGRIWPDTLAQAPPGVSLRAVLQEAWERVIAVVVQPGVEFGDSTVFGR